jgi:membrane fusion protein, adhesin transport system
MMKGAFRPKSAGPSHGGGHKRDREAARLLGGLAAARSLRPRFASHVLLFAIAGFFVSFVVWAGQAELDEVTRGQGRVIPSRQIQVVQNLEGGIVASILVRDGDIVEEDEILMRIDNVRIESDYREKRSRYLALLGATARLEAEIEDRELRFPDGFIEEAPGIAAYEIQLFETRRRALQSQVDVLESQAEQRRRELEGLNSKLKVLQRSYAIVSEELKISEPLAKQRILARTEFLQLQRQVNDIRGEMEQTELTIPRVEEAVLEAEEKLEGLLAEFRAETLADLTNRMSELTGLKEIIAAGADRVRRTDVRSPVRGTVKQVRVTTVGGVIQPGQDLVEIVPLEDTLLVEANLRPADIAFVRPGLPATVKISAYDYAIYGGLQGTVEGISADTITNEENESFYRVRVRTSQSHLGLAEAPLSIIPGMTAQVDILTGEKSVLDYLMKPILKARDNALRER